MHRVRVKIVAAVAAGVVAASSVAVLGLDERPAAACSCGVLGDREAYDAAGTVFTGTVERVDLPESGRSTAPKVLTFVVDEVLKGDASPEQTVRTEQSGASCGLEIAGPGPFLVFATDEPAPASDVELGRGELYAGLCGGTRAIAIGGPLDPAIGATAQPPNASRVVEPPDSGSSTTDVVLRVVLFLVFLVVGAVGVWAVFVDRAPRLAPPDNLPPPSSRGDDDRGRA